MTQTRTLGLRLRALDRISKVITRVKNKFPQLSRAVRKASRTFQLINNRTKKFRQNMMKIGGALSGVGQKMTTRLSLPIAFAGAAVLRTGVQFQRSINKVGAITRTIIGKNVTPQFEALEKQALLLGSTTEFTSTQAADAMALLGRAGFKTNEILASTDDVLALASASGMDLAFSADVMAKTIRQFGLNAEDATRVADVMSDVSRRTNVDLETLAETFKFAAPIAKAYGLTLEQTAAITGLLGDVGIQGTVAGTALKNIMLKLAAPTDKAKKMMQAMGVAVTTADGKMRAVGDILTEIGPKLANINKNQQLEVINELFGLRGIAGASALMSKALEEGRNPIAALTETLKGSTGAAKDMQQIMLRGAPGAMARFQSAVEGAALAFTKSGLLDAFTEILGDLTAMFNKLSILSPATLKFITILIGLVAVAGPVLATIGFMVSGIAKLTVVFAALKAVGVILAPILAGISLPFVGIAAGVVAVIAVVTRLIMKWDQLTAAFKSGKGVFDSIKRAGKVFLGLDTEEESNTGAAGRAKGDLFGSAVGARKSIAAQATAQAQNNVTTNNAKVKVEFENAPAGTKVKSKSSGPFDLDLGFAGGIQ